MRELLIEALKTSDFVKQVINALTACQSREDLKRVDCALWALENLLTEDLPKKSHRELSKIVYPVIKQLHLIKSLSGQSSGGSSVLCDRYFWILLCKATTWSKKICDKALNDDLYAHAVNEIAKGMSARGSSSMVEETKTESG